MKHKNRFPGKLWSNGKEKDTTNYHPPGTAGRLWNEYKFAIIVLLVALVVILHSVTSYGQETGTKPIGKGQQVPDVTINHILNYPEKSLKISGFCGKLLILDFWDTWCSSCVRTLPRLDSLQNEFRDRVFILPVTDQKEELIRNFLKTNGYLASHLIITAVDDKTLGKLFPHNQLPHEVWIGPTGRVLGITTAQYVNATNIAQVLAGQKPDWMLKEDGVAIDPRQPFLSVELLNRVNDDAEVYTECLTGYLKGLPLKAGVARHEATTSYYYINHTLLHLYTLALNSQLPITANRRILNAGHPQDFVYTAEQGYLNEWESRHCFSYEATVPNRISKEQVMQQLKSKLDSWLGFAGSIRPVLTNCLVLRRSRKEPAAAALSALHPDSARVKSGGQALRSLHPADLVYLLNQQAGIPPVIDASGDDTAFNLDAADTPKSVAQWNSLLRRAGLELQPEKRMLDMFVLEKPAARTQTHQPFN